ncbi:MAG: hypothetical protein CSA97_00220 [Bacteroidetes bacterium]|nr:MAG: hypothetical protein CSA97_00220 [Bacteroidota bacterium]
MVAVIAVLLTLSCGRRQYPQYGQYPPPQGYQGQPQYQAQGGLPQGQSQGYQGQQYQGQPQYQGQAQGYQGQGGGQAASVTDQELAERRRRHELRKLELEEKRFQAQLREFEERQSRKRTLEKGGRLIYKPCMDQSYDDDEFYRGFGEAEGMESRVVKGLARQDARMELGANFMGTIIKGAKRYQTETIAQGKTQEGDLSGVLEDISEKTFDRYFRVRCMEAMQTEDGTYVWYVAGEVPISKTVNSIADELDVRRVKYDRDKFLREVKHELKERAAQKKAERDEMEAREMERQQEMYGGDDDQAYDGDR